MSKSASSAIVGFLVFAAGLGGFLAGHELGKGEQKNKACQCDDGGCRCSEPVCYSDYPPPLPPCDFPAWLPSCPAPDPSSGLTLVIPTKPANAEGSRRTVRDADGIELEAFPEGFRSLTEAESAALPPPIPDHDDRAGEMWQWIRSDEGEYRYVKILGKQPANIERKTQLLPPCRPWRTGPKSGCSLIPSA